LSPASTPFCGCFRQHSSRLCWPSHIVGFNDSGAHFAERAAAALRRTSGWKRHLTGFEKEIAMSKRTSLFALAAFVTIATAGISAQAMPVAPLDQAQAEISILSTTAGGCGWGEHRGPYGGCRAMFNCPPGWHSGPFGRHCFRN
jgi:hypothetical protein